MYVECTQSTLVSNCVSVVRVRHSVRYGESHSSKKPLEEWRGFLRRASAAFAVVVPASTCTASAAPTAAPTAAVGACARRLQGVRQFGTQQGQLGGEPVAFTHAQHGRGGTHIAQAMPRDARLRALFLLLNNALESPRAALSRWLVAGRIHF